MSRGTLSRAATSSVVKGRSDSALAASPDSDRSTGAISVGGQSDLGQDHNVAIAPSSTYRSSRPTPSRQQRDYPPHPAPSSAFIGERRLDLCCFQPHTLSACRFPIGFDFDGPRRARNVGNSAPTVLFRVVIHWMAADSMVDSLRCLRSVSPYVAPRDCTRGPCRAQSERVRRRPSNGHRTESEREWLQASRVVEHRPSADFFTQLGKCPSDRLAGSPELRSWATRMA
jgi:hypothetical protein